MASQITNIIVVMLENRSYDNVLGWLYNTANQPPYNQAPPLQIDLNGLTGDESNPNPSSPGSTIQVSNASATTVPSIDPGEIFGDMAQQIYGLPAIATTNPYTSPPPTAPGTAMQGFTTNYAALTNSSGPIVPSDDYGNCITYFTPAQVPVSAFLANNFAVCDQWYASAPCQTFTNRVFSMCAAPGVCQPSGDSAYSLVNDPDYFVACPKETSPLKNYVLSLPSVLSALDQAFPKVSPTWKLYFHDYAIAAMTVPYVFQAAFSASNVNVATYDNSDWGTQTPCPTLGDPMGDNPSTFVDDLNNGTLPMLSFIEPRYSDDVAPTGLPSNCNHPGLQDLIPNPSSPAIDVAQGETFLADVYNRLAASSIWGSCLLIVTYDEHGGMYDHVPPPAATSPGSSIPAAQSPGFPKCDIIFPAVPADPSATGFTFNYFGGRVPAIIVSPLIPPGSAVRPPEGSAPFDHTSIIKTVWECFNLAGSGAGASLTQRDLAAPSLMPFLTATSPNSPGQYTGADAPPSPQTGIGQSAIANERSPAEIQKLFQARVMRSVHGGPTNT